MLLYGSRAGFTTSFKNSSVCCGALPTYFSGEMIDFSSSKVTPKASSEVIEKLLKSAIANAENNHHMAHEKLYVAEIYANQGPTLKRIRPAAKGSAVRIRKRTSHITIVLKERD